MENKSFFTPAIVIAIIALIVATGALTLGFMSYRGVLSEKGAGQMTPIDMPTQPGISSPTMRTEKGFIGKVSGTIAKSGDTASLSLQGHWVTKDQPGYEEVKKEEADVQQFTIGKTTEITKVVMRKGQPPIPDIISFEKFAEGNKEDTYLVLFPAGEAVSAADPAKSLIVYTFKK